MKKSRSETRANINFSPSSIGKHRMKKTFHLRGRFCFHIINNMAQNNNALGTAQCFRQRTFSYTSLSVSITFSIWEYSGIPKISRLKSYTHIFQLWSFSVKNLEQALVGSVRVNYMVFSWKTVPVHLQSLSGDIFHLRGKFWVILNMKIVGGCINPVLGVLFFLPRKFSDFWDFLPKFWQGS